MFQPLVKYIFIFNAFPKTLIHRREKKRKNIFSQVLKYIPLLRSIDCKCVARPHECSSKTLAL